MKNIESVKHNFLAKKGYRYKNVDDVPKFDSAEVDFVLKAEANERLDNIEEQVKMIGDSVTFFIILQVISAIASIVLVIKILFAF